MAVLASRLLAPPSLTRLQRELASDAPSLALSLFLSSWHGIDDDRFGSRGAAFESPF